MDSNKLLVGAIDFGTTYSGWAYSFVHEYRKDPTNASMQHWYSGSSLTTEKTPSCALLDSDGKTLVAFGYEAENKYRELVEKNQHKEYYYFRRFKMALDNETISRDLLIKDEMGKYLPAITVFSLSIDFLANNMLKTGKDRVRGNLTMEDVHWVLTVPAIWSDAAKQFMREAADKANLKDLTIVLEPEAASIFCRNLPADKMEGRIELSTFPAGTQYIVIDAGGGTVDITVHEVNSSGGLKEIHAASGGGWGGILVDKAFEAILIDLLGRTLYDTFTVQETEDWLDLWRDFEVKKKEIAPNKDTDLTIRIPSSIRDLYMNDTKCDLAYAINQSKHSSDIEMRKDRMVFRSGLMKSLFDNTIQTTVTHVKQILLDSTTAGKVQSILMVGGMAESPMLKEAIRNEFSNFTIITPREASSSILRGSVIFGHNPQSITQRVLRKSYGIAVIGKFVDGKHLDYKKVEVDGVAYCPDLFQKIVETGQMVIVGEALPESPFSPAMPEDPCIELRLYASDLKNPEYIDDGCICVGTLTVDLSVVPADIDKHMVLSLIFSDTEIKATARVKYTGQATKASFNFMG